MWGSLAYPDVVTAWELNDALAGVKYTTEMLPRPVESWRAGNRDAKMGPEGVVPPIVLHDTRIMNVDSPPAICISEDLLDIRRWRPARPEVYREHTLAGYGQFDDKKGSVALSSFVGAPKTAVAKHARAVNCILGIENNIFVRVVGWSV
jgi:hypothetical protein